MLNFYKQKNHLYDDVSNAPASVVPKKPVDIGGFEDPIGGLGGKDFKWGVWYVKHRLLLYKILVGLLGALAGVLIIWGLVGWGAYLITGWQRDRVMEWQLTQFTNYTVYHPLLSAPPLEVGATTIWEGGVNKYDLVTTVTNPSDRFVATLKYYYLVNGTSTPVSLVSILPGQTMPVVSYGVVDYPGSAELVFSELAWKRVPKKVTNVASWQEERLQFLINNFSFVPAQTDSSANAHAVRFDLTNNSAYGYVEAEFNVGLTQGGILVGMKPLSMSNFKTQETRAVDMRLYAGSTVVDGVVLYPVINVYDQSVYLPVE